MHLWVLVAAWIYELVEEMRTQIRWLSGQSCNILGCTQLDQFFIIQTKLVQNGTHPPGLTQPPSLLIVVQGWNECVDMPFPFWEFLVGAQNPPNAKVISSSNVVTRVTAQSQSRKAGTNMGEFFEKDTLRLLIVFCSGIPKVCALLYKDLRLNNKTPSTPV